MYRKIEISHKTIIFTVLFILSLGLLFLLKTLILELFVALLFMIVLDPFVTKLSKYRVPRMLSILVTYAAVIGIFVTVVSLIIPAVVEQTSGFISAFPDYLSRIGVSKDMTSAALQSYFNTNVGNASEAIFQFTFSILNNIVSLLTILVFAFYMLISRDKLEEQLANFFGHESKKDIKELVSSLEHRLGGWASAELILMTSIAVTTYIGLTLLGIPYALPLSILAGLLELVPFLGPIISAIPMVIIGFGISPITGIGVAALSFLIQQLEGYVLVPKVMQKSAGVSPLVTLVALAIGARLAGVVGAIISVPIVLTLQVLVSFYIAKRDKHS